MEVFNVAQAANKLHISKPTMLKLLKSGKVKAGRAGSHWKVSDTAIEAFLRGGERSAEKKEAA